MYIDRMIEQLEQECISRIEECSERLKRFPEGHMRCYKNGNRNYACWFYHENERSYISKGNEKFKKVMAEKAVLEAKLKDAEMLLCASENYLRTRKRYPADCLEKLLENAGLCRLLSQNQYDRNVQDWIDQEYDKNRNYPEELVVPTITGLYVRSKVEALCVSVLDSLQIPFHYEQMRLIGNSTFYPDFTLLRPSDGKIALMEVFGMMDSWSYAANAFDKLKKYNANGYMIDDNLFCFFEKKDAPLNVLHVKRKLEEFISM